jgi:hypothetical protein
MQEAAAATAAEAATAAVAIAEANADTPVAGRLRGGKNKTSPSSPKRALENPNPTGTPPKRARVKKLEIAVADSGHESLVKTEIPSHIAALKVSTPAGKEKLREILTGTAVAGTVTGRRSSGRATITTRSAVTSQNGNPQTTPPISALGMTLRNAPLATSTPTPAPAKPKTPASKPRTPRPLATPANPKTTPSSAATSSLHRTAVTAAALLAAANTPTPSPAAASTPSPVAAVRGGGRAAAAAGDSAAYTAEVAAQWRQPAASADSVATYAAPGARAFRQVRSTKRGSFEDEVVVLVVRFVVV